jgi:hypothetical protein
MMPKRHFKNWILASDQGGREVAPAGIHRYGEDVQRTSNAELELKDIFEMPF